MHLLAVNEEGIRHDGEQIVAERHSPVVGVARRRDRDEARFELGTAEAELHVRALHALHFILFDEVVLRFFLLEHSSLHVVECVVAGDVVRRALCGCFFTQFARRCLRERGGISGLFPYSFVLLCAVALHGFFPARGAGIAAGGARHGVREAVLHALGGLFGRRLRAVGTGEVAL